MTEPEPAPGANGEQPVPPRTGQGGGLARAASADRLSARALIDAIGGPFGVVEALLPPLAFLVIFTVTHQLVPSVVAPLALAVVFLVLRIVRRSPLSSAVGGALATALAAALALLSGKPEASFIPGLWTNAIYGAVFLVSVLVRVPILGVAISFLMGDQATWRREQRKRRLYDLVTLLWIGMFALRLAIELPLYFATAHDPSATDALATWRLVLGLPLYAPVVIVTVLAVRAVYGAATPADVRS